MKKELKEVAEKLGYEYLVKSQKAEERITREIDNHVQYALLLGDTAKVISRRQNRQIWLAALQEIKGNINERIGEEDDKKSRI